MDLEEAAQGFAAMGSEARIRVLNTLIRAGRDGVLNIGELQERTGMAPSTLAHHLRFLTAAGLVVQERQGRSTINRANFAQLELLAGFILNECCMDVEQRAANDG